MFLKARKHATIGYLNLCIALQNIRRRQLRLKLIQQKYQISQIDMTIGRYLSCGSETYVLQLNGQVISNTCPVTALEGMTIKHVLVVPGKIINLITQ